ncbi:MAG: hypothetical protein PHQ62_03345 [Clostridia bacterium]|nr:hypothetical protein [Clostridia bacterium]
MNLQIETKINELEKRISAKSESVDISPLENAISSLENVVGTNTADIATNVANIANLESAVSESTENIATNATSIENLQTAVGSHSTQIETLETQTDICLQSIETIETDMQTITSSIATNAENIATNIADIGNIQNTISESNTNIETNATDIAEHETRITNLEANNKPKYFGNNVEEITMLESKIFEEEPFYYNGGSLKVSMGTKGANGPYGTIFTRINPMPDNHYVGTLKLFLSNIPNGQTTTRLDLIINGTATALTPTFVTGEDYNLLLDFDFFASQVSNVFKVQFTDILLVDTVLDYVEITAEKGINFLVLNRDYSFKMGSFIRTTGEMEFWYSKQESNQAIYAFCYWYEEFTNDWYLKSFTLNPSDNMSKGMVARLLYLNLPNLRYYYLPAVKMECHLINENNTLETYQTEFNWQKTIKTNVNQFDYSYNNGTLNTTYAVCGTTLDQEMFLSSSQSDGRFDFDFKLCNNPYPNQFVQLNAINDFWVMLQHSYFMAGYLGLHNTGTIIYFPNYLSDYFIVVGKGTQPNAYIQENRTTINIYYNNNGKVIKKQLNFNTTTEKWELSNFVEIFPTATEVIEAYYNTTQEKLILIGKINNTWELI